MKKQCDVTTRAKAEGAIEGVLSDYRMSSEFGTAFRFSRFDAIAAPVRNVSALRGQMGPRHALEDWLGACNTVKTGVLRLARRNGGRKVFPATLRMN